MLEEGHGASSGRRESTGNRPGRLAKNLVGGIYFNKGLLDHWISK